jgi:hypothetical protein
VIENFSVWIDIRRRPPALSASGFGGPWFALCTAFALHILDEAATACAVPRV